MSHADHPSDVHAVPEAVASDGRVHDLTDDCWCGPRIVSSVDQRAVVHQRADDAHLPRWLAVLAKLMPEWLARCIVRRTMLRR